MKMQLEEIMKEACEGHTAVLDANNRSKSGALVSGAALLKAKALVPHGEWDECLKKHFNASNRTAQRYMRVAREVADGSIDPHDYETLFRMEQAVASKRISGSEPQSHEDDDFDFDSDEDEALEDEPEAASSKQEEKKTKAKRKEKKQVPPDLVQIAFDAIHKALMEVSGADRAERVEAFQKRISIYQPEVSS